MPQLKTVVSNFYFHINLSHW